MKFTPIGSSIPTDAYGNVTVTIYDAGGNALSQDPANVDDLAAPEAIATRSMTYLYDGATWDRARNNQRTEAESMAVALASDQTWALATGAYTTLFDGLSTTTGQLQSTTPQESSVLTVVRPRVQVYFEITKTLSPTRFQAFFQWSDDNSSWFNTDHGPWALWHYVAGEVSGTYRRCTTIQAMGQYFRMALTASGTANATNYFTVKTYARDVYL